MIINGKELNVYKYEGQRVFLALLNDMDGVEPIASVAGVGCYPVELYDGQDDRITDDQIYGGTADFDIEIVDTECVNPENEQYLIEGWWTTDYAEWDVINRELCTCTSKYHHWHSELTSIADRMADAYYDEDSEFDFETWESEWKDTCDEYLKHWSKDNSMELPEIPTIEQIFKWI